MEVQIQLDIENCDSEIQQQIDHISDSLSKSRKRLFAEIGEVKKLYQSLKEETELLRSQLQDLKHQRDDWTYSQDGCLFSLRERRQVG